MRGSRGGLVLAATTLIIASGCPFQIPAPTYIHQTRLISVKAEVVELGPLNPGRVGLPSDAPIAEPMPHDRFSFEAVVVDPNGDQLPASELESIWFQCDAYYGCYQLTSMPTPTSNFDQRCDALEPNELGEPITLSMDTPCRIGEGDGRFEFVLPELGPYLAEVRVATYYGVIAWKGRSAEDCWATRRTRDALLDNCAFIKRRVKVGPSWWMLAYADEVLGIKTTIQIWEIPFAVYGQAANRTPSPQVAVWIDDTLAGTYPDVASFSASPGALIELAPTYDEYEQFGQTYFVGHPAVGSDKHWFEPAVEFLSEIPHTTNAIHSTADIDSLDLLVPLEFVVDEYAEPGRSTIFLVHSDDRYGEGVVRLDFEVEP